MIFEMQLGIMKSILRLMEFKFGGRDSDQYKYIKEQLMNYIFDATKKFFQQGLIEGIFEKCKCSANLRQGWKECSLCSGSGFCDKVEREG
jgi:hypothetical protein